MVGFGLICDEKLRRAVMVGQQQTVDAERSLHRSVCDFGSSPEHLFGDEAHDEPRADGGNARGSLISRR